MKTLVINLVKNYQRTEILLQLCERSLKYLSSTHLNIGELKKGKDNSVKNQQKRPSNETNPDSKTSSSKFARFLTFGEF